MDIKYNIFAKVFGNDGGYVLCLIRSQLVCTKIVDCL